MTTKKILIGALLALAAAIATPASATYTVLPSTSAPSSYATAPSSFSWVACDPANGNSFPDTGRELLLVHNTDTAAHSVTVASVADALGRTGDSTKNMNGSSYYVFQFFPPQGWRQTSDGSIHVNCTDATIQYALIYFP